MALSSCALLPSPPQQPLISPHCCAESTSPPLIPALLSAISSLPLPPPFDPTATIEPVAEPKSKSQKLGFGGSAGKVTPAWMKLGGKSGSESVLFGSERCELIVWCVQRSKEGGLRGDWFARCAAFVSAYDAFRPALDTVSQLLQVEMYEGSSMERKGSLSCSASFLYTLNEEETTRLEARAEVLVCHLVPSSLFVLPSLLHRKHRDGMDLNSISDSQHLPTPAAQLHGVPAPDATRSLLSLPPSPFDSRVFAAPTAPPKKKVRKSSTRKPRTKKLELFQSLPLELVSEVRLSSPLRPSTNPPRIASHPNPSTLLALSRTSRIFRALLLAPAANGIWVRARKGAGLPELTAGMSEVGYARLVWDRSCHVNLRVQGGEEGADEMQSFAKGRTGRIFWALRVRFCKTCSSHQTR